MQVRSCTPVQLPGLANLPASQAEHSLHTRLLVAVGAVTSYSPRPQACTSRHTVSSVPAQSWGEGKGRRGGGQGEERRGEGGRRSRDGAWAHVRRGVKCSLCATLLLLPLDAVWAATKLWVVMHAAWPCGGGDAEL